MLLPGGDYDDEYMVMMMTVMVYLGGQNQSLLPSLSLQDLGLGEKYLVLGKKYLGLGEKYLGLGEKNSGSI